MALIDVQRRMLRTGAIRLGTTEPVTRKDGTPMTDKQGRTITRPAKLSTFRITSPHRDVATVVAEMFGGELVGWVGTRGPEFEVITTVNTLPVLVPRQNIDPWYEYWGKNVKVRMCDGATERLRGQPCLCRQFDNHTHRYSRGKCMLCSLPEGQGTVPHVHEFGSGGTCVECGCTKICKPTTRLSLMIEGVPNIGVFKLESHGYNAAAELPGLADVIRQAPHPLPATLGLRSEEITRMVFANGRETMETRRFYVPELRFTWITPEALFGTDLAKLETAAKAAIDRPVFQALAAAPALTRDVVLSRCAGAETVDEVRTLWGEAKRFGLFETDPDLQAVLTERGAQLRADEVIDAELID